MKDARRDEATTRAGTAATEGASRAPFFARSASAGTRACGSREGRCCCGGGTPCSRRSGHDAFKTGRPRRAKKPEELARARARSTRAAVTWPSTPRPARHNAPALSRTEAPPPTHARIARLLASPPPNTPCRFSDPSRPRSTARGTP
ncbi:uncharacterized protein MICPUCDRAFT_63459 [Micromonas pusilla CCMP1545]|uniref:Predicted protein n=1 Tax=Micromonas pusilla (strain CCMP1545) TaxID=564608 RepID=C1MZN7_MICPC|nr:uncharacterized protein MICPUCDRAFT_63459 [Micromonas pusilla CCMP1545]EEH54901.1 predicted protein [Micromonas pusilla CCMP1545]|eukprot:XP_003061251.1 predicted protein [Micromonas pusilla CCMP1545]